MTDDMRKKMREESKILGRDDWFYFVFTLSGFAEIVSAFAFEEPGSAFGKFLFVNGFALAVFALILRSRLLQLKQPDRVKEERRQHIRKIVGVKG